MLFDYMDISVVVYKSIHYTSCFRCFKCTFVVPFEEDDKDPSIWFLDHNYHEAMFSMFKRINGSASYIYFYLSCFRKFLLISCI